MPWTPGRRLRHIIASISTYTSFSLIIWLINSFVFGYSDTVAIVTSACVFLGCALFMMPLEQLLWANPMMLTYFRERKHKVASAPHYVSLVLGGLFCLVFMCLPLVVWIIPPLIAEDSDKRFTKSERVTMWVGIALSFLTIPLNAGWGPVADTFVSKFPQYLLSDLVGEYSKSMLAVLVDKTSSISARRQRLGILHHRQVSTFGRL